MKARLLEVKRVIEIQDANDIIGEVSLNVELSELLKIVTPIEDDYLLYNGYELNPEQLELLKPYSASPLNLVGAQKYFLTATGIYDWGNQGP
jgi:hypothetical protein